MIETSNMTLNKERAAQLAASGIHLRAKVNTPLVELVNFTTPTVMSTDGDYVFNDASDSPAHNAKMEEYADFLADAVARHIDYARNVVSPALEVIMDRTKEGVAGIQVDPFAGFAIKECGYPPILDLEQFQSAIDRYNTGTNVYPNLAFRYPVYNNEQIIEACHTGSNNIDKLTSEWLAKLPAGQLQTVWQSVFQDKVNAGVTGDIRTTEDLFKDYDNGLDNAVIVFLLCERLSQDIGAECGLELVEARDGFVALRAAAVTAIKMGMQRYESYLTTSTVVNNYNKLTRTLSVNRQVYREWIASGGKIEILYGFLVMGKNATTKSELEEGAVEALSAWNWHNQITQSEQDARFVGDVKTIACSVFDQCLDSVTEGPEQEALASVPNKVSISEQFRKLLSEATPDQIRKNYLDVVWRAACQARYFYTNAYKFLSEMNYEIIERGQDPQDAATQATATYISDYIAGMVEATRT